MRRNEQKEAIIKSMVNMLEQGLEVSIPFYQSKFPNKNYRTLAYYLEMATYFVDGQYSGKMQKSVYMLHRNIESDLRKMREFNKLKHLCLFLASFAVTVYFVLIYFVTHT